MKSVRPPESTRGGPRILVVEDQAAVALDIEHSLRSFDFDVVGRAASGEDAIRMARELAPDLILMDIHLPGRLDGVEAARVIREDLAAPVVYLSAYSDTQTVERAKATAPFGFVVKPFQESALRCAIEVALRRSEVSEECRRVRDRLDREVGEVRARHAQLAERMRTFERLETLGHLSAGIAHDFNNVLTVILTNAESLAEGSPAAERADEILRAAKLGASLTRQILDFGRGKVSEPCAVDLHDVLEGSRRMLERLIGRGVTLTVRLAADLDTVVVDRGQLEQVIMNLAVNARDAMPDGGSLLIEASNVERDAADAAGPAPGGYVRIAVTDSGSGMTAETMARAFEAFFTTKPVGKGTGLGLATCRSIVEESGGRIVLESELGRGTTVNVELPRAREARPPRLAAESHVVVTS